MSQNRQLMKARLGDLQAKREQIRKRALTNCRNLFPMINPQLSEVVDMDIPGALDLMEELVMQQAELINLGSQITALEDELYG